MKIDCKRIAIEDNEFQLSLTFYQKEEEDSYESAKKITIENVMDSIGEYISITRSYAEDEFDSDYIYLEASDFEKSTEIKSFTIDLFRRELLLNCGNDLFKINFKVDDLLFNELKTALGKICLREGILTVHSED